MCQTPYRLSMKINSELIVGSRSQHTSLYKTIVCKTIGGEGSWSLGEQIYLRSMCVAYAAWNETPAGQCCILC